MRGGRGRFNESWAARHQINDRIFSPTPCRHFRISHLFQNYSLLKAHSIAKHQIVPLKQAHEAIIMINFGAELGSAQMSIRNKVEGCLITSIQIEIVSFHEIYIL